MSTSTPGTPSMPDTSTPAAPATPSLTDHHDDDVVKTPLLERIPGRGGNLSWPIGIAGAAGIVRFRTPVDDPKDVTILFLLMGLGMATGLGAFAVAGLATAFLCIALLVLDKVATQRTRLMAVEMVAAGRQFPTRQVEAVLVRNKVVFEPREISQGKSDITVKYHTWLDPRASLDDLSAQLMAEGGGVESVSWDQVKREKG